MRVPAVTRKTLSNEIAVAQGMPIVDTTATPSSPALSAGGGFGSGSTSPGVAGDTVFRGVGGSAEATFRSNGS